MFFFKKRICSIVLCILAVAYYAVIVSFSVVPAKQSASESGKYVEAIEKIIVTTGNRNNSEGFSNLVKTRVHSIVRKTAHMINFSILGFLVSMMFFEAFNARNKKLLFSVLFLGGFCSVGDEFTQLFVKGRAARLTDIFWDMSGILFGLMCFFILIMTFTNQKERVRGEK